METPPDSSPETFDRGATAPDESEPIEFARWLENLPDNVIYVNFRPEPPEDLAA